MRTFSHAAAAATAAAAAAVAAVCAAAARVGQPPTPQLKRRVYKSAAGRMPTLVRSLVLLIDQQSSWFRNLLSCRSSSFRHLSPLILAKMEVAGEAKAAASGNLAAALVDSDKEEAKPEVLGI